jgi:aquaporin Z
MRGGNRQLNSALHRIAVVQIRPRLPRQGVFSSPGRRRRFRTQLTLGLVSVILGTSSGARNIGPNAAIAIGGYIGIVAVWGAPVTGASMNPMRSLAPDAVGGQLSTYWIYLVGP